MTRWNRRNFITVVCLLTIALVAVILFLRSFESIDHEESKTTDTWSFEFAERDEKLDFLAEYLIAYGEIVDAEYHVVYHDNSTGLIPGPSDWDVRMALKINPNELPLWLDGFTAIASDEISLTLWDGLNSDSIAWNSDNAEYYRREGEFSYLVTFPDSDIILKAVSSMAYQPVNDDSNKIRIADELKYPIMIKAYTDLSYPCAVMLNNEADENRNWLRGTYDEMLSSLEDNVLYAPPILGDFDRDGIYETIYTASKWDAPPSMWFDVLLTKDEFLQGIENLENGLETNTGDYDITVDELTASIHPELPEFTFQERKRLADDFASAYNRLNILLEGELIATFNLLDYTLWGDPTYSLDNIELVDFNFDGYKDIVLFDRPNGNWNMHSLYFRWDIDAETFVHTDAFAELGLPSFDEENQLVYSMQRSSASDHWYFTHKYIGGNLMVIEKTVTVSAQFTSGVYDELIDIVPAMAERSNPVVMYYLLQKLNMGTMEMEVIEEKYQLYDVPFDWEFVEEYTADSDVGVRLSALIDWERMWI